MTVHAADLGKLGAGQHQQVLGDGQVVHVHHPQVGVIVAQVQHGGNIARVAVLKGHHAVGSVTPLHGGEYLVPGGAAHGLGVGEQCPQRDVRKGPLHALIGGAVLAQNEGFVLLGHVHHVLDMVFIIRAQRRGMDAGGGLFQHGGFPRGIKDRQAVGTLVLGHLQHSGHAPLKQGSQLGVHFVDLGTGLFQCVHGGHILYVWFGYDTQ